MNKNLLKIFVLTFLVLVLTPSLKAQNAFYCEFDGTDDYIVYNNDATLQKMDAATNYTIEAWIYPNSVTVAEYDRVLQRISSFNIQMYDGDNDGTVNDWYFVALDGNGANVYFNTEGDATLTLNAWNHIAVINNASAGTLKLYVNGVDVTVSAGYTNYTLRSAQTNDNFYVGQKGNTSCWFDGYIDEVRLKKVAETPANLHFHTYDNEYTSDANTAALFHFNAGSGTTTVNSASSSNATLYNGPVWTAWNANAILPLSKYTWNGGSTNWSTTSNWSMSAVPTTGAFALIPSSSNNPIIGSSTSAVMENLTLESGAQLSVTGNLAISGTLTDNGTINFNGSSVQAIPAQTYNNLTINNSAGVNLAGNINVAGALTLTNGILTSTAANKLTLTSTASVSGGSNTAYVDGPMSKIGGGDFVFPVGDGDKFARIGISNLSASESFTAEYSKAAPANNTSFNTPLTKVSLKEYWALTRAGTATASVTLYWDDSKWSGIGNTGDLRIAHYNGSTWDAESGTYSTTGNASLTAVESGSITVTGVSSFSPFSFGTTDNTTNRLPVELLSFEASVKENVVELSWITASELNNYGFDIQRSTDANNWETLGFIEGVGNSNTLQSYRFVDVNPETINYYRLKQIDFDGNFKYSETRVVKSNKNLNLYTYPNPVFSTIHMDMEEAKTIEIYDVAGRKVHQQIFNSQSVDVSHLQCGFYFILISKVDGTQVRGEFLKQ